MFAKLLAPMLMIAATAACVPTAKTELQDEAISALTAVSMAGSYAGTLPCADCSGIDTKLTLNNDMSYNITESYQGKGKPFVTKGTYTLDKTGTLLTLIDKGQNRTFKVGNGIITAQTMDGSVITGPMAAMMVLTQVK